METTKERAARCDRATHARRSSSLPAYGSRTASITRRRRRAKRKALRAATLAAAVLLLGGISVAIFTTPAGSKQETNILPPTTTVGTYIPDTPAPAAETVEPTEPAVRYPLTDAERDVDQGETVVDEPILYFYNPALVTSDFHESQIFVIEEGGHRFFAERSTR